MKNFRSYQLAVKFYRSVSEITLPSYLKDQLDRASSSIVLNLAEGSGRFTRKDQKRFYHIAFASLRECQAILDIKGSNNIEAVEIADKLAANIYCLIKS
ncbi:MAG: four helix bundle protein [Bdellovibrionota bacterium]